MVWKGNQTRTRLFKKWIDPAVNAKSVSSSGFVGGIAALNNISRHKMTEAICSAPRLAYLDAKKICLQTDVSDMRLGAVLSLEKEDGGRAVSYTHLDVYNRQYISNSHPINN